MTMSAAGAMANQFDQSPKPEALDAKPPRRSGMALAALVAACVLPGIAHGQGAVNIKANLAPTGGTLDHRHGELLQGETLVKLTPDIGFDVQGLGGRVGGSWYWGVATDLFWRDPAIGAFGPIAIHQSLGGQTLQHFGAAGSLYLANVDLNLRGGYQGGNFRNGGFGEVGLGYYWTSDFAIGTSSQVNAGAYLQTFAVEYLPHWQPLPNTSVFGDGAVGQRGAARVLVGLRFYFGDERPLQDHRREDSIANPLIFDFKSVAKPRPTPPPPPPITATPVSSTGR